MTTSYLLRNYAKEYSGEPITSVVSYTGLRTQSPIMIYQNAYEGSYRGFEGIYVDARGSRLAYNSVATINYAKTYTTNVNYNAINLATYSKTWTGAGTSAGSEFFQKAYSTQDGNTYKTGAYIDNSVWAAANISKAYLGTYSQSATYSSVHSYEGTIQYQGMRVPHEFVGRVFYVNTFDGMRIAHATYTKAYQGAINYTKLWTKTYTAEVAYRSSTTQEYV